jgi:hypothetical protein
VQRTARTIDLAIGERREGPILVRQDGRRQDRRTAHRWVKCMGKRTGLGLVHPPHAPAGFIMAALDAGRASTTPPPSGSGPIRQVPAK